MIAVVSPDNFELVIQSGLFAADDIEFLKAVRAIAVDLRDQRSQAT